MTFPTPRGEKQIIDCFGDIKRYINQDGTIDAMDWELNFMGFVNLPYPLPLAWDLSKKIMVMKCHKKLVPVFSELFAEIVSDGLWEHIKTFGGCYNFRTQRNSVSKLSLHSWGAALDLNTETNQQGTPGDMDESLVKMFNKHNFEWGGTWSGKRIDPCHFQFAVDY